jgi:hypothetical protein
MRDVIDTFYVPGQKSVSFDSDGEAIAVSADEIATLQRLVMAQMRTIRDLDPKKAQEEPVIRHVTRASEIVRGLRNLNKRQRRS